MAREEVKSIEELDRSVKAEEYFGKGIKIASGFDLGTAAPLDTRSIVKTIEQRDKFATDKIAYEGMHVYVEATKLEYIFKDGTWVEFGFNAGDADEAIKGSIVNDLTTGGVDKALSAEQGKVLKGLIDQEVADRTAADGTLQEGIDAVQSALDTHKQAYTEKVGQLDAKDAELEGAINDLKSVVSNKNSDNQVFATMEEFSTYATTSADTVKKGDLVYVVSVKKSYIYQGLPVSTISVESPVPPAGWIFFDEITNELDLAAYAKKTEVTAEIGVAKAALEAKDLELDTAIKAEVARATGEEAKIREEFAAADATGLQSAKDYTDEAIANLNSGALADRVTSLEGKVDVDTTVSAAIKVETDRATAAEGVLAGRLDVIEGEGEGSIKKAIADLVDGAPEALDTLKELADALQANQGSVTTILEELAKKADKTVVDAIQAIVDRLDGEATVEGSVKNQIKVIKDALDAVDAGLDARLTQAETDIIENAKAIIAIEARRFILTRSQEILTFEADKLVYALNLPVANAIIDVRANSVVLERGIDYTYDNRQITFTNQHAVGKKIHVVYTYNELMPEVLPEMDPVVDNAIVGRVIVG